MPLHIEDLTSEITVVDGDSLLTDAQKEALVQTVLRRLAEKARESAARAQATSLRRQAAQPLDM